MNRVINKFKILKKEGKKALIVYITGGYPSLAFTKKLALLLEESGADMLEIGIPFSDPIADGPTIQKASEEALKAGANLGKILRIVKDIRRTSDMPIIFMSYFNPIYRRGARNFIKDASLCGADGVIIPDLPPEEAADLLKAAKAEDFCVILLTSPTSTLSRLRTISKKSSGFIYYVSLTGVTGARESLAPDVAANLRKMKRLTRKPVCAGFGVSDAKQARAVARIADGVIVGSAVIKEVEKSRKSRRIENIAGFVSGLARAVHGG